MKTPGHLLFLFAGLILLFTRCEKSPESRFDVSSIPGVYTCTTDVLVPSDTLFEMIRWGIARIIPAWDTLSPCCPTHIVEIHMGKNNQFTLTFQAADTLLPDELTVEITGFHEYSWDEIQANIRVTANDLYKSTVLLRGTSDYFNWFRYSESAVSPTVEFNLLLKSKSLDNLVLECRGRRYYD